MAEGAQRVASLVGNVVKAKVASDDLQGELYAYDPASQMLALSVPTEPGSSLKHWVVARGEHVSSIESVEGASPAQLEIDDLAPHTLEAFTKREKKAMEKAVEDARHVNTEVTNEVQNVYNALRKTMPCEWDGTSIIVMGLVTIRGPRYTPESCEGADESSLSRVRKVVSAACGHAVRKACWAPSLLQRKCAACRLTFHPVLKPANGLRAHWPHSRNCQPLCLAPAIPHSLRASGGNWWQPVTSPRERKRGQ